MAKQNPSDFPAEDVVVLELGEGTRALVHMHGANLLSWVCDGEEQIFLSSKSIFDGKKAIRGGIPLVFPNFGPWSAGPQHGFARTKRWKLGEGPKKDNDQNVVASLTLEDDEETRSMWDFKFKIVYELCLCPDRLITRFNVDNTDNKAFDFTCLLHTYFRVSDITKTTLRGLHGLKYDDKVRDGKDFCEDREVITVDQNYDRIYKDNKNDVVLDSGNASGRQIQLTVHNLPDIVVWNPWEEKSRGMADFDDDGWRHMLCVEAGRVAAPCTLEAGQTFRSSQQFALLQPNK